MYLYSFVNSAFMSPYMMIFSLSDLVQRLHLLPRLVWNCSRERSVKLSLVTPRKVRVKVHFNHKAHNIWLSITDACRHSHQVPSEGSWLWPSGGCHYSKLIQMGDPENWMIIKQDTIFLAVNIFFTSLHIASKIVRYLIEGSGSVPSLYIMWRPTIVVDLVVIRC